MSVSVFERMSLAAARHGAVNLGQGFPDFGWPDQILDAAARALKEDSNQYAPSRGLPQLRQAIADHYGRHFGQKLDPDHICVTSGATEALGSMILSVVEPGDEVIIFTPAYDSYAPMVRRAGATPREVTLQPPSWNIDRDAIEAALSDRTRAIIFNNPQNPTGRLYGKDELQIIADIAIAHELTVISDEVWEHVLLHDEQFTPLAALPGMAERTLKAGSAGKIFSLTGWKIGWAVAAPPLAEAITRQHQYLTFTTPTPLQWAVAEGLALPSEWHAAHRARYEAGRERLVRGLSEAGYVALPSEGTWFVTIDLAASDLPPDDEAVAERLIREAGVASIPVSAFCRDAPERGYLRLCFAKEDATLDEAVTRLAQFRNSL